ncbi:MAG: xylose isomerase [Planctomycetota bacterium]|nr:MAG: xylose isomerase [Planctomycetota bacterium]
MTGPTLAYCSNIHPADGLGAVTRALVGVGGEVRRHVAPRGRLAIGLRLSDAEAREFEAPGALRRFSDAVAGAGLRVACLNGFPFGAFHGGRVKEGVHRPDWRDEQRVAYTERLGSILARLLPEGAAGGVSTSPLSYAPWGAPSPGDLGSMTRNIARVAARFARLRDQAGRTVHLDVEPEPDGLIETVAGFARWFERDLAPVARSVGLSGAALRRHVRLCLDACHLAVMFEPVAEALGALERVGARVGRVQASSAIQAQIPGAESGRDSVRAALAPFAESTYLHQTVGATDGRIVERWPDLPDALASIGSARARSWRVHYHVPIFWSGAGVVATTQPELEAVVGAVLARTDCRLFEIETYTWSVLPADLRLELAASIARELAWLEGVIGAVSPGASG